MRTIEQHVQPSAQLQPDYHIEKPLVSLITPAYNEAGIIIESLNTLCAYMENLEDQYRWEIMVVNDGSSDGTGAIVDEYIKNHSNVRVAHHTVNKNLGTALQTGFRESRGEYVIVLDLDLSYAPEHIERLLAEIREEDADIVIASPYMKGGKSTAVPFLRLLLSKGVNKFMKFTAGQNISTFTGMVRAYNRRFLKTLNLKSSTFAVNPEIIYKGILLRARIVEIPAHLDWTLQVAKGNVRTSGIRIFQGIMTGLMSGFIFRPYMFFMAIGLFLLLISIYMVGWIFINTFAVYPDIQVAAEFFDDRFSMAVAEVFRQRPHAFFTGGITLIIALQFLSLGFLSLQSKRNFEELFHINTTLLKNIKDREE